MLYATSKEGADRVVDEITKRNGRAVAIQGDVAKAADVERIFAETKRAFGQLDILVNNAGVYEFALLEAVTEEQFHRQFNTNVLGLILVTREAVKYFGESGGSVINIGSVASRMTPPSSCVYTAWPPVDCAKSQPSAASFGLHGWEQKADYLKAS